MEIKEFCFFPEMLFFEYAPRYDEGTQVFKLTIRDGRLWVESTLYEKAVTIEGAPLPGRVAKKNYPRFFPLSKWEVEPKQFFMMDGPFLEIRYAADPTIWIRSDVFSHEAAHELIDAAFDIFHLKEISRFSNTILFQETTMPKEGSMELQTICNEVLAVEEGLMYGTIPFEYDNLMSALKP